MAEMDAALDQYGEVETGEPFTRQGPRLLKVELSETSVMAKNGAMVAYQGDVHFEHKGGGLGRLLKKAATGEQLRLMEASGAGELFLASQAMLVHVLRLNDDSITVNGENILAFQTGIDWDVTRVKGGTAGVLAGGLFNIHLRGTGLVALVSDGEPVRLDVSEAPTFADPQAAIAWSGGVQTTLRADVQAKTLIGLGSGESFQLGFAGSGWVLVQPSEGRAVMRAR
ncbi:MAG TPA: AIM24 family protein [Thermoleophilaceae bacterium]|nr:AIM24 family protein [Thermoleophilaceae bacterium]